MSEPEAASQREPVPVSAVKSYWESHPLGMQFVSDETLEPGSRDFFDHIRPWMGPYRFPWIMERIDKTASRLRGKHLLEIGCGLGFDSAEFMRRGVRVTATDLTSAAVALAKKHFELEGLQPVEVRSENVRNLPFADETFDGVWARGVLHATGDTAQAVGEVHRVLKPGGLAVISHFYRRPSWMHWMKRFGRENIEAESEDPPANEFLTEGEILALFKDLEVIEAVPEHYRVLPIARRNLKAVAFTYGFKPLYNALPESVAKRFAYKFSVTAIKK